MMKKPKEVAAMTIKLFHDYVKNQADKYWRYYMMWYNYCDLADSDPKKFIKQESESGSAMWDDPPDNWSERDLYIWSKGYVRGREVECGNVHGIMRQLQSMVSEMMNKDYGFRDGLPTNDQVQAHTNRTLTGFWMLMIDNKKGGNDFIRSYPSLHTLQINDDKLQYWGVGGKKGEGKWRNFTKKDKKEILSGMPLTTNGIPCSWDKLKMKKIK